MKDDQTYWVGQKAFIRKGDEVLVLTDPTEGLDFPGGKIQEGETGEECIVREIEEELSVIVDVVAKLEPVEFDYGFRQVRLKPFVCRIISGEIKLNEHTAQWWLEYDELEIPKWSEADRELIVKNKISLKQLMSKADL